MLVYRLDMGMWRKTLEPDLEVHLVIGQTQLIRVDADIGYAILEIRNDDGQYTFEKSQIIRNADLFPSIEEGGILLISTGKTEAFNKRYFKIVNGYAVAIILEGKFAMLCRFAPRFMSFKLVARVIIGIFISVAGRVAYEIWYV